MQNSKALELARANWSTSFGLLCAMAGGLPVAYLSYKLAGAVLAGIVLALWSAISVGLWARSKAATRCPKSKIGFVVAFDCETPETRYQFRSDFVDQIQAFVSNGTLGSRFWFRDFSGSEGGRVVTHEDAQALQARTKARFVLFGKVRTRGKGDKVRHVVDIHGLVWHGKIVQTNQDLLREEFSELVGRRIEVSDDLSLPVFETTSVAAGLAAQYIIGIVLLCSVSVDQAEEFFLDLRSRIEAMPRSTDPVVRKILARIPARIAEIGLHRAHSCYQRWRKDHVQSDLEEVERHLESVVIERRNHPIWWSLSAIVDVVVHGNVFDAEQKLIKSGKRQPQALVGLAFLRAVQGDLRSAVRKYRDAYSCGADVELAEEFMDFIEWYKEENAKVEVEMNFCLGFSAYKILKDKGLAAKYFEAFRNGCPAGAYTEQLSLIDKWMASLHGRREAIEKLGVKS